jgi:hypothetical protein
MLADLPPEILVLLPLAIAAGIDLYLTLLFLGVMPTTTWWSEPLPGALGDLDSLGVMVMLGGFYILEFTAERFPTATLVWNAFHTVIRPVSGALLALLLLDGQPPLVIGTGAVLAGGLASAAHSIRSGASILRWLGSSPGPHPLLTSLVEDVVVLGIVALVIDQPTWALVGGFVIAVGGSFGGISRVRAFIFAVRLCAGRLFQTLGARRWTNTERFPQWVRAALEGDVMVPGGGRRGSPVGAHRLPGAPPFVPGWVVVGGDSPIFVFHRRQGVGLVELSHLNAVGVIESGFFRRVDLTGPGEERSCIFFALNGPSAESLRAEFTFV